MGLFVEFMSPDGGPEAVRESEILSVRTSQAVDRELVLIRVRDGVNGTLEFAAAESYNVIMDKIRGARSWEAY